MGAKELRIRKTYGITAQQGQANGSRIGLEKIAAILARSITGAIVQSLIAMLSLMYG